MSLFDYMKLLRKYNTLETEYEVLKEEVKEDCFNRVLKAIGEPEENTRLREDNANLRKKIKELKNIIKNNKVGSK